MDTPQSRFWALPAFFVLCFAAAGAGGALTSPGIPWLATLNKPAFQPPDSVFGPVWTVLYTLMAISGWLVFRQPPSSARSRALGLFALQLALNTGWSLLFFYLRLPFWALVEIVLLLTVLWMYVFVSRNVSRAAALLFVPYGLWVGFATLLTAELWRLNR